MIQTNQNQKTALVTGAGSGIGLATSERFLKEGWRIIAVGRRMDPLLALTDKHPDQVLPISCDISQSGAVDQLKNQIQKNADFYQGLSVIINNAGIFDRRSIADSSDEHWTQMFEINLLGSVRLTRTFLTEIEHSKGCVINVSSTLGSKPVAQTSAYSALKAAMINWTQTLALELSPSGARANCVCPGIIDTPIHSFHGQTASEKAPLQGLQPLGRLGKPEDVAHAIWSLCAPGSEWITGATLNVDGGISLA